MAMKSQITGLARRIEALAATRTKPQLVVVCDHAEAEAIRRRDGRRADNYNFIITGVPRAADSPISRRRPLEG